MIKTTGRSAKIAAVALFFLFTALGVVVAQDALPEEEFSFENAKKEDVPKGTRIPPPSEHLEYRLAQGKDRSYHLLIVSGLMMGSLIIILAFLTRGGGTYTSVHFVTATGLPLVIFGTILVILLADTEQQLTAAVGILGAVAGYIFRSLQAETAPKNDPSSRQVESSESSPPHG